MAETCGNCLFFQLGYRAGVEQQYRWTTEDTPGVPLTIGRCAFDVPSGSPVAEGRWGWPRCHQDDWCGKWRSPTPVPENIKRPTISGNFQQNQMLTADAGEWYSDLPMSLAFAWANQDGMIVGALGQQYLLPSYSSGWTIQVLVTGTNANGSSSKGSQPYSVS